MNDSGHGTNSGQSPLTTGNVIEGEFIGAGEHRQEQPRGGNTPRGAAIFRTFQMKPAHKALAAGTLLVFLPIVLAILIILLCTMLMRMAFFTLRLKLRG